MTKKTQSKTGELVFGVHSIIELLKAKRRKLISIYTVKPAPQAWTQIEKILPKYPVPVNYVSRDALSNIAGTTDHQNIIAWAHPFPYRKKMFDPAKERFIVMLDGIQDARNLGAIIRSGYCTGVDGVVLVKKGSASLNAAAIKASAGLAEHVEIYMAASAQQAAFELHKAGYTLYMAAFGGHDASACAFNMPLCLVIGGEGFGISKDIMKYGTQITIPQRTKDISYNASVAAGILLFLISTKNKLV
jgi:23S rRNA (guanosine2251-2'-O)-methyltransferase